MVIIFSKFVCGQGTVSEALKTTNIPTHAQERDDLIRFSTNYRPIVVWNMTKRCNLKCEHCYIEANIKREDDGELTTLQAKAFLKDLVEMKIPLVLFSGGEPLIRHDFRELVSYARSIGLRVGISTNGTLIDEDLAKFLAKERVSYVGISVDSADPIVHDDFRGVKGSLDRALKGISACQKLGIKTGVRITVTKKNYKDLPDLYAFAKRLKIPRFCLYYLVPSGRGKNIQDVELEKEERNFVFEFLYRMAKEEGDSPNIEIVTTDGPFDGPMIIEKLKEEGASTEDVMKLMEISGGCSAGEKIANVDNIGNVHPCQFWTEYSLGNVKEEPFSVIWNQINDPLLNQLRNKEQFLKGKCGDCDYRSMCKGCRIRAKYSYNDLFETDPACIYAG